MPMNLDRSASRQKLFTRRAAVLGGGKLALASLLVGRMYWLQVVEAEQYQMLAEENRINMRLLAPPRGRILDRFGRELASNRQNYRIVLVPEQTDDVAETLNRLGRVITLTDFQVRRILREARRNRAFLPINVAENLSWEEFAQVNVRQPDLPGVQPDVGSRRYYPFGSAVAHVVGYVSSVTEKELTGDPLLELPGFRTGKSGIEKRFDQDLRGSAGNSRVEVNAYGRVIRELQRNEGRAGSDHALTIDLDLQQTIDDRLSEESAACVVMDVHDGEVLALVSTPSYDPNAFNAGLSSAQWQALIGNPRHPLLNKATAGEFPPGSTFKMVVALAALEAGVISPDTAFFCNGKMELGDNIFHCWRWRYGGHGKVAMRAGLAESCDVYFYEIALRVGVDRIAEMARRLGLGEVTGLALPGERDGLVPTKAWKQAEYGRPWQRGETLNAGIGQGYLLATPLQLAVMTARIANGGYMVRPRLLRDLEARVLPASAPQRESLGLSRRALKIVQDGMFDVVNGKRGTARTAALAEELGTMAGKTGTAQVRRISKAERQSGVRKAEEVPWEERDHGLFVAYAPAEAPRYALSLIIEHGGSGAATGRVAGELMARVLQRDPKSRPAVGQLPSDAPVVPAAAPAGKAGERET